MAQSPPVTTSGASSTVVATVAELATKSRSDFSSDVITLESYSVAGDLGGGNIQFLGTVTPSVDEIDVTHFADAQGKYWKRINTPWLTPHHAGYPVYYTEALASVTDANAILNKLLNLRADGHDVRGVSGAHYYSSATLTIEQNRGVWDFGNSTFVFPASGIGGFVFRRGTSTVLNTIKFGNVVKLNWGSSPPWLADTTLPNSFDEHTPVGNLIAQITDIGIKIDGGNYANFTFESIRGFHFAVQANSNLGFVGRTFFKGGYTRNCRFETVLLGAEAIRWLNNVRWRIEESQISSSIDMGGKDAIQCWIGVPDPTAKDTTGAGYFPNLNGMEFGSFEVAASNSGKLIHVFAERCRNCDFRMRVDSDAYYSAIFVDHPNDGTVSGNIHDWQKNATGNTVYAGSRLGIIRGNGCYNRVIHNHAAERITAHFEALELGSLVTASGVNDVTSTNFDFHEAINAAGTSLLRKPTQKNYRVWQVPDKKTAIRTAGFNYGVGFWIDIPEDSTRRGRIELHITGAGFRYGFTCIDGNGAILNRGDAALGGRALVGGETALPWANIASYDLEYIVSDKSSGVFRHAFHDAIRKVFVHCYTNDTVAGWIESISCDAFEMPGCRMYCESPNYRWVVGEPKHGVWNRSDDVRLDDGTANSILGYRVSSNGERYAQSAAWSAGMSIQRGQWVKSLGTGDEIWQVTTAAVASAGSDEPTGTTPYTDNAGNVWTRIASAITADAAFSPY